MKYAPAALLLGALSLLGGGPACAGGPQPGSLTPHGHSGPNDGGVLSGYASTTSNNTFTGNQSFGSSVTANGLLTSAGGANVTGSLTASGAVALSSVTIQTAAPTTPTINTEYKDTIIKGYVIFSATNTAALGVAYSVNVTSVSYVTTGEYYVNWTVPFSSVNIAVMCTNGGRTASNATGAMSCATASGDAAGAPYNPNVTVKQTFVEARDSSNSRNDFSWITVMALGAQ